MLHLRCIYFEPRRFLQYYTKIWSTKFTKHFGTYILQKAMYHKQNN